MKTIAALALLAAVALAHAADPVGASYTVTGTSGNYDLNFTFSNNSGDPNLAVYFLGVNLDSVASSPTNFTVWSGGATWNPYNWDGLGPNIDFKANWYNGDNLHLSDGESLSGFVAHSSAAVAPTSVQWFAYGIDNASGYDGHGSYSDYYKSYNPGFTGTAQAVPEPASFAALGVGALGLLRRRRRA